MGKLITVTEASRLLGVTLQTLRNWTKDGHIKVKKIGHSRYLDEDTVNALQDTAQDIAKAKKYLDAVREEHEREVEERRLERDEDKTRERYMDVMTGAALKCDFFKSVVSLMRSYGSLTGAEADLLTEFLNGETTWFAAKRLLITKTRVRQVINKAIRKSGDIARIEKEIEEAKTLRAENDALRECIEDMKEKLHRYENPVTPQEEEVEEYRELCQLLSTRVRDLDFTVRALNCLKSADIETVGDLIEYRKADMMKLRNFGKKTFWELDEFLLEHNLSWGTDVKAIYKKAAIYK